MNIKELSKMNYSEFVGFVDERNRPSGGIKTVHEVAVNSFIDSTKKILEIGSNTGFTSVNLNLLTGCEVIGVETNKPSIIKAQLYAGQNNITNKVSFVHADAQKLPFDDSTFDLVWCSNVTSFVDKKSDVISEYLRVLKLGGTLVVIPIYYVKEPSNNLITAVSEAIDMEVNIKTKNDWKELFINTAKKNNVALELYYESDYNYLDMKDNIHLYIDLLLKNKSICNLSEQVKGCVRKRAEYFYKLFNKNLKHAGYSILLYQKRKEEDQKELFLTKKL